jgi:hypothetical protein
MTRLSINIPLVASVVAIAFASLVMAAQLADLAEGVLTPRPREDPTRARIDSYLVEHAGAMNTYRGRFDGRSVFFKPKPPPPPPRPIKIAERVPATPPPPPGPTAPPLTYSGPSISFVVGNEVWFHDGSHASVGEAVDGVTIIASDPPWTVTLGYGGGEYRITLFQRKELFADQPTTTSDGSFPGLKSVRSEPVASNQ